MPQELERRQIAIRMLNEWKCTTLAADWWADYVESKDHPRLRREAIANAVKAEADRLLEEILMLMGVDDIPAGELEIYVEER